MLLEVESEWLEVDFGFLVVIVGAWKLKVGDWG